MLNIEAETYVVDFVLLRKNVLCDIRRMIAAFPNQQVMLSTAYVLYNLFTVTGVYVSQGIVYCSDGRQDIRLDHLPIEYAIMLHRQLYCLCQTLFPV